eukprot:jgi/Galph1/3230/GphlegSOOS_G1919.1
MTQTTGESFSVTTPSELSSFSTKKESMEESQLQWNQVVTKEQGDKLEDLSEQNTWNEPNNLSSFVDTIQVELEEMAPLQKQVASSPALNFTLKLTPEEKQVYRDMQLATCAEDVRQSGKVYAAKGQIHLAILLFRLAVVKDPLLGKGWQDLSKVVLKKFGIIKAREILIEAVHMNPDNHFLCQSLGLIEQRIGNIEGARNAFKTGLEKDPTHLPLYSAWARMEFYQNRYEEARSIFQKGLSVDPQNARFYLAWAQIELRAKNYEEAIRLVCLAEPLDPKNVYLWQTFAQIATAQKRVEEARRYYTKALELEPNNVVVLESLAKLEAREGNVEEARQILSKAIQLEEKDTRIYACWAAIESEIDNVDFAVELLQKALRINSSDSYLWLQYAQIERKRRNIPRARALFKRGADTNPLDWVLWEEWSHMEASEGNKQEADHLAKRSFKAKSRSSGSPSARH